MRAKLWEAGTESMALTWHHLDWTGVFSSKVPGNLLSECKPCRNTSHYLLSTCCRRQLCSLSSTEWQAGARTSSCDAHSQLEPSGSEITSFWPSLSSTKKSCLTWLSLISLSVPTCMTVFLLDGKEKGGLLSEKADKSGLEKLYNKSSHRVGVCGWQEVTPQVVDNPSKRNIFEERWKLAPS